MRVKLSEKYKNEREDICNRLIEIINLDSNNSFLLSELDQDTAKQERILAMKDEIKKYFACSEISALKPNIEVKRPYLNIVRGILRKQGYQFFSKESSTKGDNPRSIQYTIFRNNQ
jgi:hypothetical protein